MKKFIVAVLMLISLCGCAQVEATDSAETTPTLPQTTEVTEKETESNNVSEEDISFESVDTSSPKAEQKSNPTAVADKLSVKTESVEVQEETIKAPPVTETKAPTSTLKPTPTPAPTPKPTPVLTPTPTPEPQVDIAYWVSYAKNYASSLGLHLDSSAVDCWDNPITATSKSTCLERDISSRLNRYAADEDITDVWVWSESIGNGSYNIYIGYA